MKAYHGSLEVVQNPDTEHSFRPLDFGKGFYVTTVKEQAEKWARRKMDIYNKTKGIINEYEMSEIEDITDIHASGILIKTFPDDLEEWLDFVCDCRDGGEGYKQFDVICGKVANDKVFRVVDMYHQGIWDKGRAIKEIRAYENYDQYAFISQRAIDMFLKFERYYEV